MHNRTFTCTSTWTKFREGGSGIQKPPSKTWDNTKKVYYSLVTQEKVLVMKTKPYFANKMALKRYEIQYESCLLSFKTHN
jgi:hypothetical protein